MACDSLDFTPSEIQVESELDQQLANMRGQLAQQGIGFDLYCQMLNTTEEKLREENLWIINRAYLRANKLRHQILLYSL